MKDGETGYLVREGNAEDIIDKIKQFLENKEIARDMGVKGAKFVKEEFNWEHVTHNFLKIIKPYLDTK